LANVAIQVYLTAAVMNLKRLATAFLVLFLPKYALRARRLTAANPLCSEFSAFCGSEPRLAQMAA